MRQPLLISHRTNMGTMPENTLAGIDAAIADGADGIEVDVRATADRRAVLLHDATLARTTGDARPLAEVSLSDLAAVRTRPVHGVGPQPVPTLRDALRLVAGRAILVIEVKERGVHEEVAAEVRAAGAADWCWIWAFDPAVGRACRVALPEVPVGLNVDRWSLRRQGYRGDPAALAAEAGFAALSLSHGLVDGESVARAHRHGLAVYTWTVDETQEFTRVREAGVEAVCSNLPRRLRAYVTDGEVP